ncbi:hypothetical protein LAX5112_02918 [Roseibium alexandrii]|uniref:Uncharacterized protein n=1 Tax=Roseibium alexandrii TaxID=388408 RepID=A0A0M7AAS4_9HYPH|nr:hypothetical protein LAX5112_02918 [Roseibium alexandrii]
MRRPGLLNNLQEVQRDLPIASMIVRHQPGKLAPVRLFRFHFIHQGQEIASQPGCIGGRSGKPKRLIGPQSQSFAAQSPFPGHNQPGHRQMPVDQRHRWRQRFEVRAGTQSLDVLVGIADGPDDWQEYRPATEGPLKQVWQQARSAARRQVKRC